MINFFYEEIQKFRIDKKKIRTIIGTIIEDYHFKMGEINIIFCNDSFLVEINNKYLCHNNYTDIITFDNCENTMIAGDLFISKERVEENSVLFSQGFNNELNRVIFHGILHLIGFNDVNEREKNTIREREDYYINLYNIK